ncbi:putative glycosyltransferase 7 [Platanthera zijinensis]|uniref:Glycosyltransferase 7 n=1 Tax=Platanthera zijinensis TaxID=2320716 RepID=A0AAP0G587_9ASPA
MTPEYSSKSSLRSSNPCFFADCIIFSAGATTAVLLFWTFSSILHPIIPSPILTNQLHHQSSSDLPTFYDDPSLSYSVSNPHPISDWDNKRRRWLRLHPSIFRQPSILMLTGSQPSPCPNPKSDHLLLRLFKNKADYCRLHSIDLFYNTALLHPSMPSFWAKIPLVRAAMIARPEIEWLWWVDSDAAITDMEFELPLRRYESHNLVVHGWPDLIYNNRSWTALNAGVLLIRNCQWSLDLLSRWARLGPQDPDYQRWGQILRAELPDKLFPDSDDQSALIYLLLREKGKWGEKIYLESEYYLEGYWAEIVGKLKGVAEMYLEMEREEKGLRRRRSEKVMVAENRKMREKWFRAEAEGGELGRQQRRRPFITHFTGCQPCSGEHNNIYSGESCYEGMVKALSFADDQVLRAYGFRHRDLLNESVVELHFDFPAVS